ncbi:MAG: outer membrane beta-barrel protein, partial [Gemmataceae bacterium]
MMKRKSRFLPAMLLLLGQANSALAQEAPGPVPIVIPVIQPVAASTPAPAPVQRITLPDEPGGMLPPATELLHPTAFAQQAGTPEPIVVPALPSPAAPAPDEELLTATPPERWWLMRSLQGTWMGAALDNNRLSISGWTEASYNLSTADVSNSPVVWDDRANRFLLQQHWIRIERNVVTSDTAEPSWGFRFDTLIGSDYRFSIPRGLLNGQLANSDGVTQNLYGVDLIQHYVNAYFPNVFKGLEVRVGRLWTPWGV